MLHSRKKTKDKSLLMKCIFPCLCIKKLLKIMSSIQVLSNVCLIFSKLCYDDQQTGCFVDYIWCTNLFVFNNEDGSFRTLLVTPRMRISLLCLLLIRQFGSGRSCAQNAMSLLRATPPHAWTVFILSINESYF